MHGVVGHSIFTQSVSDLVDIIDGASRARDSLFEQAEDYFAVCEKGRLHVDSLKSNIEKLNQAYSDANKKSEALLKRELKKAKVLLKEEKERQHEARKKRLQSVFSVCEKLIRVSEGETWEKTQTASARILGTLLLLCPNEGINVQQQKQRYKPAYKAVLAIRLLDKLLNDNEVPLQYLRTCYEPDNRYCKVEKKLTPFHHEVVIPLITAAIFQDVGLLHPDAQKILKGKDGKRDKYEVLEKDDRMLLLKLNHKYTLEYLMQGLGAQPYAGDSKPERDAFNEKEEKKVALIKALIVGALQPKEGVGNLIKVPQIYTSFIFSSKPQQTLLDLPKAGLLITNAAKRASVSEVAVESLLSILGHFPQGYGITYITKYPDGSYSDFFEYAIVIGLNPSNPFEPICRKATRNLSFIPNGQTMTIGTENNLYYPEPKKLLEKINPERLKQILKKLVSNYEERKDLDLIPSYWDPHVFFQYEKLQNLWKNT